MPVVVLKVTVVVYPVNVRPVPVMVTEPPAVVSGSGAGFPAPGGVTATDVHTGTGFAFAHAAVVVAATVAPMVATPIETAHRARPVRRANKVRNMFLLMIGEWLQQGPDPFPPRQPREAR